MSPTHIAFPTLSYYCRIAVGPYSWRLHKLLGHYRSGMFAAELKQVTRTMKVNTTRVTGLRKQRSWSQDELATAAGLNLRTVQRIENEGTASLESLKAIASALQVDLLDLKYIPESRMRKFEYKTVVLPFRMGIFKQGLPDIQTALNKEGQQGWRFTQMVLPSTEWGKSDSMVAILERAVDDAS